MIPLLWPIPFHFSIFAPMCLPAAIFSVNHPLPWRCQAEPPSVSACSRRPRERLQCCGKADREREHSLRRYLLFSIFEVGLLLWSDCAKSWIWVRHRKTYYALAYFDNANKCCLGNRSSNSCSFGRRMWLCCEEFIICYRWRSAAGYDVRHTYLSTR